MEPNDSLEWFSVVCRIEDIPLTTLQPVCGCITVTDIGNAVYFLVSSLGKGIIGAKCKDQPKG